MSKKPVTQKAEAEKAVKDIRRATRKVHSAEEKIRIVLAGLRGEDNEPCRAIGPSDNGACRAVPPRGHCTKPVLQLVEGVSRGWEEAPGGG